MFMPSNVQQKGIDYRETYFQSRPVWIAASTHEGEEKIILNVHKRLLEKFPELVLILVPRHPERFMQVNKLIESYDFDYITRNSSNNPTQTSQVMLIDTLGELPMFYAAADIAFVGGSLVPIGGHNLLEPAALSLPMLVGVHTFNAPEITEMLEEVKALKIIYSQEELYQSAFALLSNRKALATLGNAGKQIVKENHGALQKILLEIKQLLPPQ